MSRTRGARNADYDERRSALIERLRGRLADRGAGQASMRELAASAEVSVPTLTHYFGGRDDVIAAVLEHSLEAGQEHLAYAATPQGSFASSIRQLLDYAALGHRFGVSELHRIGLTEGIGHPGLGPAYVEKTLEPTLQAIEKRLSAHVAAGEMREANVRHAALQLLAPLLFAQLHQHELGGDRCRPLDTEQFIVDHADMFVRAYGMTSAD